MSCFLQPTSPPVPDPTPPPLSKVSCIENAFSPAFYALSVAFHAYPLLFSFDQIILPILFAFASSQLTDPPVIPCASRPWYKKTDSSTCTNAQLVDRSTRRLITAPALMVKALSTFDSFSACCSSTGASSYNDTCNDEVVSLPCPTPPTTPPVPPPETKAPVTPKPQPLVSIFMNECVFLSMLRFLIFYSQSQSNMLLIVITADESSKYSSSNFCSYIFTDKWAIKSSFVVSSNISSK